MCDSYFFPLQGCQTALRVSKRFFMQMLDTVLQQATAEAITCVVI
jgi:hypothetical protein